jgi:hypothetical protein
MPIHGPAGLWPHSPKMAEFYVPFGNYLRFGASLSESIREVSILATPRECNEVASAGRENLDADHVSGTTRKGTPAPQRRRGSSPGSV